MNRRSFLSRLAGGLVVVAAGSRLASGAHPLPTPTPRCRSLDSFLRAEADRISADIHKAALQRSPWADLAPGDWPEGMGSTIQTLTYERRFPHAS